MEFAFQVALSSLAGGLFISLILLLSEKIGSRVGGAIAGAPTTILVSLISISLIEGEIPAQIAASIIPLVIVMALLFTWIFIHTASRTNENGPISILIATAVWLLVALPVRILFDEIGIVLTNVFALLGISMFYLVFRSFPHIPPKKKQIKGHIYFVRFLSAGTVVGSAVVAARLLGPVWGGIVGCFPAAFSTTIYFLNKSQGLEFTKGFVRRLPASVISSLIFVNILSVLLTRVSVFTSFIVAILAAYFFAYGLLAIQKPENSSN